MSASSSSIVRPKTRLPGASMTECSRLAKATLLCLLCLSADHSVSTHEYRNNTAAGHHKPYLTQSSFPASCALRSRDSVPCTRCSCLSIESCSCADSQAGTIVLCTVHARAPPRSAKLFVLSYKTSRIIARLLMCRASASATKSPLVASSANLADLLVTQLTRLLITAVAVSETW